MLRTLVILLGLSSSDVFSFHLSSPITPGWGRTSFKLQLHPKSPAHVQKSSFPPLDPIEYPKTLYNYEVDKFVEKLSQSYIAFSDYEIDDFRTENIEMIDLKLRIGNLGRTQDAFKYEMEGGEVSASGALAIHNNVTLFIGALEIKDGVDPIYNVVFTTRSVDLIFAYTATNIKKSGNIPTCDLNLRLAGIELTNPIYMADQKCFADKTVCPWTDMTEFVKNQILPITAVEMSSLSYLNYVSSIIKSNNIDLCEHF